MLSRATLRGPVVALALALSLPSGCAGRGAVGSTSGEDTFGPAASRGEDPPPPPRRGSVSELVAAAEAALAAGEAPRAVAAFSRALAAAPEETMLEGIYPGLARAHEQLGDCAGALAAHRAYLERFGDHGPRAIDMYLRKGACEAELEDWARSADTLAAAARAAEVADSPPSVQIEALARQGFALFSLDRLDEALAVLDRADEIYEEALRADTERFSTFYFVGMARFYRAAVWHRRFRAVGIRSGERQMSADFERKLALLTQAQEAYNHTIRAKHVFWVSAAGYQLGSLFEEFYDALMYAPVPDWLDARQRSVYYEELKTQLRPVINKAIWVFEKNLETARRLGYHNPFVEKTEAQLARLQGVLLAGDDSLGRPLPPLAPEGSRSDPGPLTGEGEGDASGHASADAVPASRADRALFVPEPTPL